MKNGKQKKSTIEEVSSYIAYLKKMNEGIVFDAADGVHPEITHEMGHEGAPDQEHTGESEEEKAIQAQQVIRHEPIIGKIREVAIEGLKKYSDDPTNPAYEFFKKVFLDADKVITGGSK